MKFRSAMLLLLLASVAMAKVFKVEESSDADFNQQILSAGEPLTLNSEVHSLEGVSDAPADAILLKGRCQDCLVSLKSGKCVSHDCPAGSPSEQFVYDIVGDSQENLDKLKDFQGHVTLVLWRTRFEANTGANKETLPFRLIVSWVRLAKTSD